MQLRHRPGEAREEWTRAAPPEWETRLRAISPITDRTSHLRFRWSAAHECWLLFQCMPKAMLTRAWAEALAVHWSALPKTEQMGRRASVTDYQFWMFRTHGVHATTFWCLQGTDFLVGGTPASYTERERRVLEAQGIAADPIPLGILPNIPFDERVVQKILERDKLLAVGGDLDRLEQQQRPEHLKAMDEETERAYRRAFLKWNREQNEPVVEFMKWFRHQESYKDAFVPAPADLPNKLTDWQDRFVEHGYTDAGLPTHRKIQVAVR